MGAPRSSIASGAPVELFGLGPRACAACAWVAHWLSQRGIAFREIDITRDERARERLRRATSDELPVPTLMLPEGTTLVWPGPVQLQASFPRARRTA